MKLIHALELITAEYIIAQSRFEKFNNQLDDFEVLLEAVTQLWDSIKHNLPKQQARDEAIQVAAMAIRFITDCT